MKRLLILVVASVAGCGNNFRTCSQDSECQSDGVCSDGVCYQRAGGGGGDGGVGSGGGGVGGGDGGVGGGQGGGTSTPCSAGCAEWQTCRPTSLATGICENARVRALSPQANTELGAGNTVTFVFEVTQWDGGMWPSNVPVSVDDGMVGPSSSRLTRKDVKFEAEVTLANRSGAQSVVAGWAAVDAGIPVLAQKCDVNCRAWEECVPDSSGGRCASMQLTLAFTAPTESQEYGPINSGQVPLKLSVTRVDGGVFSSPVPFVLSKSGVPRLAGTMEKTDGVWQATADAGAEDGERSLHAGWDGGPSTTRTFTVTATPPVVNLYPETAPSRPDNQSDSDLMRRWKKSELAAIQVESNRPLPSIAPSSFANPGVVSSTACARTCGPAASCYCFAVDLAQQPLTQTAGRLYGTSEVTLNAVTDVLGNTKTGATSANLEVTRLKWSQVVVGTASTMKGMGIAADGKVVVGVNTGLTSAVLVAASPDGGFAWPSVDIPAATTSGPVIGTTGIYIALDTGTQGQLRKLNPDTGAKLSDSCPAIGLTYPGDMALASPGGSEFPVAIASDGTITGATNTAHCTATALGATSATSTLIVSGDAAYVALDGQDPVWKFTTLSATPTAGGQISTGTLFPANLFSIGATLVGGGGGPSIGGAFAFMDTGGTLSGTTTNKTPGTKPAGAAVVGGSGASPLVYFGDNNGGHIYRVPLAVGPSFGTAVDSGQLASTDFSKRAPLYGANGHLYVAGTGTDKALRTLNSTSLVQEWFWTAPNAIVGQLNIDKNRDAAQPCAAGQPGVLYVVTASGAAATLNAILVDSQGVDATAPWPRYQHDPANTGNPATNLSAWACP